MESGKPQFIRLAEMAARAGGVHPMAIVRLLAQEVITADAFLKHGRTMQPIFLSTRINELVATIKEHREAMKAPMAI